MTFLQKVRQKVRHQSQTSKSEVMEQRKIAAFQLIQIGEKVTVPRIAEEMNVSERQIRTVLDQLKNEGKIHFERDGRSGRWVVGGAED